MATVNVRHSDILVDRRLLAINFDELNLLQSSMLLPKPVNILALKKRFGIKLSKQDLIQDIQDKNSIIHKYFHSMIMAQIARVIWAQEEHTRQVLEIIEKKQKEEAVEFWIDEMRQEAIRDLLLKPHDELAANLPPNILISMTQAYELRYFIVQQAKYQDLSFYSQFAKTTKELQTIQQIIEKRYGMIEDNLHTLDRLRNLATTPEEQEVVQEAEENYLRHLELSSPQNKLKYAPVDMEDAVMREQYLRQELVSEELFSNKIDRIKTEYESNKNLPIFNTETPNTQVFYKEGMIRANEEHKFSWKYQVFQDNLNTKIAEYLDKKQSVMVEGFEETVDLLNLLHNALSKTKLIQDFAPELHDKILKLYEALKGNNEDNQDLLDLLRSWIEKNLEVNLETKPLLSDSDKEVYQQIRDKLSNFLEDNELPEEIKPYLNELEKSMVSYLESGKLNGLIESYNKLVEKYPLQSSVVEIFLDLSSLSFIKQDELKEPSSDLSYGINS